MRHSYDLIEGKVSFECLKGTLNVGRVLNES